MQAACWVLLAVVGAGNLAPQGAAEKVKFPKNATGFMLGEDGLTFEVDGPGAIRFEFRGAKNLKKRPVHIEFRDEADRISRNDLAMRKKKRGPRGMPLAGRLDLPIPAGHHTIVVTADKRLAVVASLAKAAAGGSSAAPWSDASGDAALSDLTALPPLPDDPSPAAGTAQPVADVTPPANDTAPLAALVEEAPTTAPPEPAREGLQRAMRVAVYNLELADIEPNIGMVVTDSLLAEVRKLEGISAIGMDEIQDMLSHEANKQVLGCEENDSCLAEIAGALGVDNLITGKLSKAADSHLLLLRRIDQQRARVVGTVDKRLKAGSGQEFLMAVGPAVEELFPDRNIRGGLERGVPREVALRLDPPPLPTWSFWSMAGVTTVVAAAGGLFGILAQNDQEEYTSLAQLSRTQIVPGSQLNAAGDSAESNAGTANALLITAGVLAVSTGVMALFTDWEGYGDESEN